MYGITDLKRIKMSNKKTVELKTACIGQCHRLKGYCTGCGRTEDEIYDWILLTQKERDEILKMPRADQETNAIRDEN